MADASELLVIGGAAVAGLVGLSAVFSGEASGAGANPVSEAAKAVKETTEKATEKATGNESGGGDGGGVQFTSGALKGAVERAGGTDALRSAVSEGVIGKVKRPGGISAVESSISNIDPISVSDPSGGVADLQPGVVDVGASAVTGDVEFEGPGLI